jgi:hypothetical protein
MFQRGQDVKRTIGIGRAEAIKINLEKLKKEKSIERLNISSAIGEYSRQNPEIRTLMIEITINLTNLPYSSPDQFLINYLPADLFFRVDAEKNEDCYRTGISSYLGDLRTGIQKFNVRMYVKPEHVKDFPPVTDYYI